MFIWHLPMTNYSTWNGQWFIYPANYKRVSGFHQRLNFGDRSLPIFLFLAFCYNKHTHTPGSDNYYFLGFKSSPYPNHLSTPIFWLPTSPLSDHRHQQHLHFQCPAFLTHSNRWGVETDERKREIVILKYLESILGWSHLPLSKRQFAGGLLSRQIRASWQERIEPGLLWSPQRNCFMLFKNFCS